MSKIWDSRLSNNHSRGVLDNCPNLFFSLYYCFISNIYILKPPLFIIIHYFTLLYIILYYIDYFKSCTLKFLLDTGIHRFAFECQTNQISAQVHDNKTEVKCYVTIANFYYI